MSKPSRPSDPSLKTGAARTFFVTSRTAGSRSLFQTDRMANLLVDVLRCYVRSGEFIIHDFVVMPNHIHVLMTIPGNSTLEKAVQLIKGNFSFRARKELEIRSEIWQRGFSDVRILDERSFVQHQAYIEMNPIQAGLASAPNEYPYGSSCLKQQKRTGAKARTSAATGSTAEAVP